MSGVGGSLKKKKEMRRPAGRPEQLTASVLTIRGSVQRGMTALRRRKLVHLFFSTGVVKKSFFFFFQAEDGIRDYKVTGVQTCALPISCRQGRPFPHEHHGRHQSA